MNNKTKNNRTSARTIMKFIALVSLLVLIIGTCSGCGFAAATKYDGKADSGSLSTATNDSGDYKKNRVCVGWGESNEFTSVDKDGDMVKQGQSFLWISKLNSGSYYGLNPQTGGILLFRDLVIVAFNAVFPTDYSATDYFRTNNPDKQWNLDVEPLHILESVNAAVEEQLINPDPAPGATPTAAEATLSPVLTAIQGGAAAVLLAIWCMGFISQIVNERFTMDTLLKTLMQLMCGIVLITQGNVLVAAFAKVGGAMATTLLASGSSLGEFSALRTEINTILTTESITAINIGLAMNIGGMGFALPFGTLWLDTGAILAALYLAVPTYFAVSVAIKIISRMIMRMLELTVRVILAPIPLAFSAQNGFSQEAMRYFRGIMACSLEPVLIYVGLACITVIGNIVVKAFFDDTQNVTTVTGLVGVIAMSVAYAILNTYIGETKRMAQEIVAR